MSYAWANNLLYRMTGNAPPSPSQPAAQRPAGRGRNSGQRTGAEHGARRFEGVEKLFARRAASPGLHHHQPASAGSSCEPLLSHRSRNGGRPDLRSQLTLDRATGEIVRWEAFSGYNRGRQLRAWARFTHTGEAGGALGQTIAVMASQAPLCWYLPGSRWGCDVSWPGRGGASRYLPPLFLGAQLFSP